MLSYWITIGQGLRSLSIHDPSTCHIDIAIVLSRFKIHLPGPDKEISEKA
ncbi:MAG TPA: hypothetical protein PLA83_07330 [Deltaproteobacteria bacterium]|jgi:hypothetical protein|nr:hypothetical protein [Deltaproteobacteria bacterium]HQI01369.1 hypothetical protein [Deltaproteobacteria bacterium]HQJ09930.1 hypothetical protein [Deltaproteobacteria bacterium]